MVEPIPLNARPRLLRRGPGVWRLEPARERCRGWMRTSDARPPFQVECSSQTPKVLPVSRAPNIFYHAAVDHMFTHVVLVPKQLSLKLLI